MKIGVLSHKFSTYLHKRLEEVGRNFGFQICFIQLSYCYMNISARSPTVYYRSNETFQDLSAIIPRIMHTHTSYGASVLRQFERMGVYTLNSALSIIWTRDKLRALQHLARKNLPMPITGFADSPQETEKLIELVGGAPLVVRLLEGSQGKGTIFAETQQAAVSVVNAFKQLKTGILVQEYIKEAEGSDIRCIVVGNKVIFSILRTADDTGFLSSSAPNIKCDFKHDAHEKKLSANLERCFTPVKITAEEKKIAIAAAKAMKLNFASVDILRSHRGPLVLDIDCFPNIEILEQFTGKDIVTPLLQFIEMNLKKSD